MTPSPLTRPIDRRALGVQFLRLAAALAVPLPALAMSAKGTHDVVVRRDVMAPMRDKVRLATDLYLPAKGDAPLPGRFPVILERTPYGKSQDGARHASAQIATMLASHGYVVVFQDCRGRGRSEGEYVKYLSDGADGFDCCAWIVEQPWCDGKIGAQGLSYGAHTVGALASAGAPGIKALFIDSGGFANSYQGGVRQGGAFELKQATWAYNAAFEAPEVRDSPEKTAALKAVDIKAWFKRWPWSRGNSPLSLVPEYEDYVFDQWEAGAFDGFWKQLGIYAEGYYGPFSDAPMTWMSSWYDPYPRTATQNFMALSKLKKSPVRLILGPWTHGNNHQTFAGDVDFGAQATLAGNIAPDLTTLRKRWFDRHLKGEANGVDAEPKVRIFVMGGGTGRKRPDGRLDHGGRWRDEAHWPLPQARETPYYLQADGVMSPEKSKAAKAERTFRYDPRHPVPSIGGTITSGQPIMVGGAFDQRESEAFFGSEVPGRPLAERADVLVFQTPPLAADTEITGPILAELWISSDCPDTDFTIKLIDVYPANPDYPEGYAMNLTDGILRCRYRDSWEKPSLMTPGQVYRIRVEAFPTSNLFKAGHRIRLDVSSSNFPHFDLNPNTGEPEGRWREMRTATNTLHLDAARPSHVVLPLVRKA
jgi:uncharacterized protein